MNRTLRLSGAAVLMALATAACGAAGPGPAAPATAAAPAGKQAAKPPADTAPKQDPPCSSTQLTARFGPVSDGNSGSSWPIVFTNNGSPCSLRGGPTLIGLDKSGRHTFQLHGDPGDEPVPTVHLTTGGTANAGLTSIWGGIDGPDRAALRRFTSLRIIPPGSSESIPIAPGDSGLGGGTESELYIGPAGGGLGVVEPGSDS